MTNRDFSKTTVLISAPLALIGAAAMAVPAQASAPTPDQGTHPSGQGVSQQTPLSEGDPFSRVVLTHDPQSSCTTQRLNATQMAYECKHLTIDFAGDSMHLQLPNDNYIVHATATSHQNVFHVRERNSWDILRRDIPYTEDYTGDGTTADDDGSGWCVGFESPAIDPTTGKVVPVDVRAVVTLKQ